VPTAAANRMTRGKSRFMAPPRARPRACQNSVIFPSSILTGSSAPEI
jgi:hypothetical protein